MSGKRFEVLADTDEVHAFGPRGRYIRIAFFTRPDSKQSMVEIDPDWYRLLKCVCEDGEVDDNYFLLRSFCEGDGDVGDDYRRIVLELLRTWPSLGIPQARRFLNQVANELKRLWWPDQKAEKQRRRLWDAELLRIIVDISKDENRKKGVKRPDQKAWDETARFYGSNSGEALRKALQASRLNRRNPRG